MHPRRLICRTSIAAFFALLGANASAQTSYYWDAGADGNSAIGGTGVWNLTNPLWDLTGADTAVDNVAWPNTGAETAVFGGAAGTVTLGAPVSANKLLFNTAGYTIDNGGVAANTLTLSGATPTITANFDAAISAILDGSAGLVKDGAGTLTLSGANTYGGVTSITAGALSFSASQNLGAGAAGNSLTMSNNGILRFTGATATDLTSARTLAIGAGGATIDQSGAGLLTLSGAISGAAANTFTKTGSGTLLLTANSGSWSGNIVVNAGTLQVGNAAGTQFTNGLGASSASRSVTVNAGAILDFQGRDATGNTPMAFIVNGGTVRNTSGFTRMGNLTLNGGTIHVIQGNSSTFQAMTFNGDVTVTGTAPSQITTTGGTFNGIHLEKSGGGPVFTVPDITGDANADLSIAVPLLNLTSTSAAQGFTKNGAGTMLLSGANAFTGTMVLNEGNVTMTGVATGTPAATFGTVAGKGATLTLNSATRLGNVTQMATGNPGLINGTGTAGMYADRTYTIGDTAAATDLLVTVPVVNGDTTARALTKTGAGTLQFDGVNTFTGTFTVNDGTVVMNAGQSSAGGLLMNNQGGGTPRLVINSGVTYRVGGNPQVNAAGNGATIEGPGSFGLFGDRAIVVFDSPAADDLVVSAPITNGDTTARSWRKESTGRMVVRGDNTYTGTTDVYRGTLVLDYTVSTGSKLPDTNGATNLRGGTLALSGNASAPATETAFSFGVLAGTGAVQLTPVGGQALTFNMNGITRGTGQGIADFRTTDTTLGVYQTTSTNNVQGLLGPWATFNGNRFATVSGGVLGAAASSVQNDRSQWQPAQNVVVDGALSGALGAAVNSLVLSAGNTLAIDNPAAAFTVRSGGVLVSADAGVNNTAIAGGRLEIDPNSAAGGAGELVLTNRSAGTLTVSSSLGANSAPISTVEALTLAGSGVIELTGRNLYTGTSNIQGNVRVSGGNALSDFTALNISGGGDMTATGGALLNLNGSAEGIGSLSGGAFTNQGSSEIQLGAGGVLTINETASTSYQGLLTGAGDVIKRGSGTLTMATNAQAYTGTLQVLGGLVDFNSGGTTTGGVTGVSAILLRGGSMLSAQNSASSNDKFANGATIQLEGTIGNGLRVSSDQNAARTETVDKLEINAGANVITLTNTTGTPSAAITTLAFANATDAFSRSNNATLLARSGLADFGGTSTAASTRVTFASGITGDLVGGGGAAGTTNVSILPFAVGGVSSVANPGDTFLTVGANGLRPLSVATEYATNYAAAAATDNLSQNATATGLTAKTVNSLRIDNSTGNVDLTGVAGNALTLTSGALLVTAGANANDTVIGGFDQVLAGAADANPDELVVHVTTSNASPAGATLTINSAIANNGAAATSLTKGGDGTLILGAANSYSGATTINQGTLQFSAASQLGADGLIRLAGGTLQWGGSNTADISTKANASSRTVELLGASPFLSPAGAGNILNAGSRFDIGANNVTLANPIGNGGAGGLTKAGAGTLTLGAAPTYKGVTMVTEGAMNFQTISPNTTSALYLLSSGGTVSSTVASGLSTQSLIVGGFFSGAGTTTTAGNLTVGGGVVSIGDGSGDDFLLVGWRDSSAGTATASVNFSGSANFAAASGVSINVSQIALGAFNSTLSGTASTATGNLLLPTASSAVNSVTANTVVVGNSPSGTFNNTGGAASLLSLGGGATTMNVSTLVVGGMRSTANMTIANGGSFTLRGLGGGSTGANLYLGDSDATGTGADGIGSLDLTGAAAIDMKLNQLVIGRLGGTTSTGSGQGTLTFDTGVVEAATVRLADANFRTAGVTTNAAETLGRINLNGGAFAFQNLSQGIGTADFNWNAGTIRNVAGADLVNQNVAVKLNGAAAHTFAVEAGRTAAFQSGASFSGTGALTKSGAGALVLNGASTYSGDTLVQGGALLANNATGSATGTGAISVGISGTLGGTGSVSGAVTIAAGGALAPGAAGLGTLGAGALTMAGGSIFALEINTSGVPASDLLASSGALTLDLAVSPTLSLADLGSNVALAEGTAFTFLTYTGGWNGGLFSVSGNPISDDVEVFTFGANKFTIDYNRGGNSVALIAVPEPSSGLLLLGGLASTLGLRRRKRAR